MNCKKSITGMGMERSITFVLAVVMFMLSGCMGAKGPPVRLDYYTLEYEAPDAPLQEKLPAVLRLERFTAAPEYETDRMVYRDSSNKRSAYYYHKWRAVPADLVTFFLKRDLAESGRFAGVLAPESGADHTHVLDGTVEEFLEWDGDASCEAVVTVNIVLLDPKATDATQLVLLQQRFTAREECEAKQPAFVARAMSRAMAQLSRNIGEALHEVLLNNIEK
jgi:ABC-type uncharacterized transport system auxiliary subunit